jgi:hypothetical protein
MSVCLLSDLLTGRTTPRATPATHPPGTVLQFQGGGYSQEDAIVLSWNAPDRWKNDPEPVVAVASYSDGTSYAEPAKVWHRSTISGALVHPYGERRGIGYYENTGDCETCNGTGKVPGPADWGTGPADWGTCPTCNGTRGNPRNVGEVEVARLSALLDRLEAEHAAKLAKAQAEGDRLAAIGAALAPDLLGDCPALIVAEHHIDASDAQTDYSGHRTDRRVILARSGHKRHLFPEMRRAIRDAVGSISTLSDGDRASLLAVAEEGEEHRENYSMGAGMYLSRKGGHSNSTGWVVEKVQNYRPETGWTASSERSMLATGDNPWVTAERAEELADAKAGKAVALPAAAEPEPTPAEAEALQRESETRGTLAALDRLEAYIPALVSGPLVWIPPTGAQTRALRAQGLDVATLKAAGFSWKKTGDCYGWVAETRTPEALAIVAALTGQPDPGGPGPKDGQPAPVAQESAPAAKVEAAPAAPAPAGSALARACADAGILLESNGVRDLIRQADRPVRTAHDLAAPTGGQPGLPVLQAKVRATMERAADLRGEADARLAALVTKARALALKLDTDADHGERDRETHTPKKLKQAMNARLDAARYRRGAALLREWAAHPERLPDWRPSRDQAVSARAQETRECSNGFHGYRIETGKPYATADAAILALRDAYPEGGQTPEQVAAAKLAALIADCRFADWEGFFPTPPALADDVVRRADIQPGMRVLEPSAGMGDLADRCRAAGGKVDVAEQVHKLREILAAKGYGPACDDCLAIQTGNYARIVANPPFERDQGIDHLFHCWNLLAPGGRLVFILPAGIESGDRAKRQALRAWIAEVGAEIEPNDPEAFNSRDAFRRTGTATCTLVADKAKG